MLQIKEELESINGGDGRKIMWFLPLCSYHLVASSKGVVSPGISLIFRSWVLKIKNRPGKKPGQIHLGLFPQFWTNSGKGKSRREATNILTKQKANANFFIIKFLVSTATEKKIEIPAVSLVGLYTPLGRYTALRNMVPNKWKTITLKTTLLKAKFLGCWAHNTHVTPRYILPTAEWSQANNTNLHFSACF